MKDSRSAVAYSNQCGFRTARPKDATRAARLPAAKALLSRGAKRGQHPAHDTLITEDDRAPGRHTAETAATSRRPRADPARWHRALNQRTSTFMEAWWQ